DAGPTWQVASELLVGEREPRRAAARERTGDSARLRQQRFGIEARSGDLAAIVGGVTVPLRQTLRGDLRGARHLPAADDQATELEIGNGRRMRRTRLGTER